MTRFSCSILAILGIVLFSLVTSAVQSQEHAQPPPKDKLAWKSLFDGKSLAGWKATDFGGEGDVEVEKGAIVMQRGTNMTGITYAGKDFPKINYEVTLEGKKIEGQDFFCTTTFPVGASHCSLVVGGWALEQLWLFWVAPIAGAALAGVVYRALGKPADGPKA